MSGNMPPGPPHMHHGPPPHAFSPQHQGRRQNDYHHPQYVPQQYNQYPYPPSPHHHQYYGMPQPQYMHPQWWAYPVPPLPTVRQFPLDSPIWVLPQQQQQQQQQQQPQQHQPHPPPRHHHGPRPQQHSIQNHNHIPHQAHTPSHDHSNASTASQSIISPLTTPTTASFQTTTPPVADGSSEPAPEPAVPAPPSSPPVPEPSQKPPYTYPLPWYSVPESQFPPKEARRRRRRKLSELPSEVPQFPRHGPVPPVSDDVPEVEAVIPAPVQPLDASDLTSADTIPQRPVRESSLIAEAKDTVLAPAQRTRAATRPVVPIVPQLPRRPINQVSDSSPAPQVEAETEVQKTTTAPGEPEVGSEASGLAEESTAEPAPIPRAPPNSWAGLFSRGKPILATNSPGVTSTPNGTVNGHQASKTSTLADALRVYSVENDPKLAFLEPRGLVNTGNMCYMNSILQVLVFCVPFYEFLDLVSKRAVHSFKSSTPLIEAMIMFMREYSVIDSANSPEQLRLRLKEAELGQYGEPFIPEYVYDAIKRLPRFSSMRRGQQQDAEEFLGLLLEVLHLECASVMGNDDSQIASSAASDVTSERSLDGSSSTADVGGWMEVGHKQKPSVTRSSGGDVESPLKKIFGGKLRSEFRVSGNKNSVTLTPYQQLQLDIGDASVSNVVDALKGMTRSERVDGTFQTPRGPQDHGTKQFFIETLPPVLILHLKRFHFEGNTTQKIWKKIGYPLELEIPKEVFAHNKRGQYASRPQGLPKYRLMGVVYHHGKNASGGHYTVDVRRQEGREWIRLDDTVIRRVHADDVAGEGGEEDPKVLAKALEQHKRDQQSAQKNIFSQAGFAEAGDGTDGEESSKGWSQVNGPGSGSPEATKKWSGAVINGGNDTPNTAGKRTPREAPKSSVKDNKVAYILFYEQIRA